MRLLCAARANSNLADEDGSTALSASVSTAVSGGLDVTRALLTVRADVECGAPTPLACAMRGEDREAASILLEAGASQENALAGKTQEPPNL